MNNETTASQPKSIGDDAQFHRLMSEWQLCLTTDITKSFAAVVSYIDNFRAPAAQASATIQAAPTGMHAAADLIDAKAQKYLDDHAGTENDTGAVVFHYGEAGRDYHSTLVELAEELRLAATINEPVMVAEPVEKAATKLCGRLLCLPQVRDGNNIYVTASAVNACVKEFLDTESAAPMVADPAGVAVNERARCISIVESLGWTVNGTWVVTKSGEQFHSTDALTIIDAAIRFHLAATVKAVPSEALDEAAAYRMWRDCEISEDAWFMQHLLDYLPAECIQRAPTAVEWDAAMGRVMKDRAPLADKTGGGE